MVQLQIDFDAVAAVHKAEEQSLATDAVVRILKPGPHRESIGRIVYVERSPQPGLFDDGLDYWIEISDGFRVRCRSDEFQVNS
jgi:hypothetical protein